MIKAKDKSKIAEAVEATPYLYLRLTDPKGTVLIGGSNGSRKDWLEKKLYSYIDQPGKFQFYQLYGREKAGKYQLICEIEPETVSTVSAAPVKIMNSKAEANFDLLQENAKLLSKVEILEFQNRELLSSIAELEKTVEDLEQTISEMEGEAVPALSENQNLLMEFAKPLLPGLQAFAFSYLSQFMPKQPTNNESPGEITN